MREPPSPEPGSPADGGGNLTIRVPLAPSAQQLEVRCGARITAVLPRNPQGTWTAPSVSRAEIARVSVRREPAGVTIDIVALVPGQTTVAVETTPPGDPRPPGRLRLPRWELGLTVRDV